jgi:hypothetical protein
VPEQSPGKFSISRGPEQFPAHIHRPSEAQPYPLCTRIDNIMSLEAEQKRRPPPIQIPEHRPVPGPNAFARAAKAQQDGAEKQEKRPAVLTPITSPLDGQHQLQPSSQPRKETSSHGSVATAFGQLVDAARSPRKSGHTSSTNSRHGSTARSRYVTPGYKVPGAEALPRWHTARHS